MSGLGAWTRLAPCTRVKVDASVIQTLSRTLICHDAVDTKISIYAYPELSMTRPVERRERIPGFEARYLTYLPVR
jgi:hypothetical protein